MNHISIGFSKNKTSPISNAIAWYMGTPFSHTYLKIQLKDFMAPSVFHAVSKGVVIVSYENFVEQNLVVKEFDLNISNELYTELCSDFHRYAGKKYGFAQILGIVLSDKLGLTKNPINDGINCSEWIAYCLEEIDPSYWNSKTRDFNLVKPAEIYNYLELKWQLSRNQGVKNGK